jgi:diguanylate cyclase (GGDEF)-like protein/PAS domain S-box-containing protein
MGTPSDPPLRLTPSARVRVESAFGQDLRRAVADLVLRTTVDGVWLVDGEARTTFVNERMAALLGYGVDEMIGLPLFHFMDEEGAARTRANLERRRGGIEERHEFRCIKKDGSPIWLLVSANPVYDRAGAYAGSLALIADLSEQKAREHALEAEKVALERKLSELSSPRSSSMYRDTLTGLYNLRYLEDRLAHEVARCCRYARRLCVILFDVDGFHRINSGFGEAAGDAALRGLGQVLSGENLEPGGPLLRASDIAARYGGDEFVVLASETDVDGGLVLGQRILERLRGRPILATRGKSMWLPVSVGVASFPAHATAPTELIAAADRAMYRAKDAGGARVCLAEALPGRSE